MSAHIGPCRRQQDVAQWPASTLEGTVVDWSGGVVVFESQGGSQMRAFSNGCVLAVMFVACGMAAPVRAQTDVERPLVDASAAPSSNMPAFRTALFTPTVDFDQVIQQPAGPPPTPRHTGIKA